MRDVLAGLGCDLPQGYLFAKPRHSFDEPRRRRRAGDGVAVARVFTSSP